MTEHVDAGGTRPAEGLVAGDAGGAGDSACWVARVCDECGALPDGPPQARCWRCGTATELGPAS